MLCKANGCPNAVDFITHWNEDKSAKWGVCRYHRLSHPDDWRQTTERINHYKNWIAFASMLQNADNDITFKPRPGETVIAWRDRIESQLRDLILDSGVDGFAAFQETIKRLTG